MTTHKTLTSFARIICDECCIFLDSQGCDGTFYLSAAEYESQLGNPDKGWCCPSCGCHPCEFDDTYFELPLQPTP